MTVTVHNSSHTNDRVASVSNLIRTVFTSDDRATVCCAVHCAYEAYTFSIALGLRKFY